MKSFLEHIKEEVLPSVQVADGGLDIEKPAVRAAINAAIAGVVSQPAVTPYIVFNRLSKLLAQYHIVLPRKFLEGDKGVEVFEIRQFGHKMGMTDSGEFINQVPTTHYLFLQYGIITPMGVTYAKPLVGGMFRVTARLVDRAELDRLLDMAEITMSEEAECRQNAAKAMAPKEPMADITSDPKKVGNKKAVATSEKGLSETRMPASVIKHKQRIANMTPEEKAKKFAGKSDEQLKSMARRHGFGKDSNEYSKTVKEDTLDEERKRTASVADAFLKGEKANQKTLRTDGKSVTYHGNTIASHEGDHVHVTTAGYGHSPSTRGHVNGILSRLGSPKLSVRKGQLHHGDNPIGSKDVIKVKKPEKATFSEDKDPCWKGYEMVGMKKKAGKKVPNCVPVKEEKGDRLTPGFGNRKDFDTIAKEIGTGKGGMTIVDKAPKGGESSSQTIYPMSPKSTSRVAPDDVEKKLDQTTKGNPQAERNKDLQEKAPPGREDQVRALKKKFPKGSGSPFAIAWSSYKKSHSE